MQRAISFGRTAQWLTRSGLIAACLLPGLASAPPAAAQSLTTVFISDAAGGGALEGNDEVFTITVSGTHPDTTVSYGTLDDTAYSGYDYVGVSTLSVVVPSTASSAQIRIKTVQDTMFESDESFVVGLRSTTYGTIITDRGKGVIWNDDPRPSLTVSNPTIVEGDSGVTNAVFAVGLTNPSDTPIRVRYQTADVSATGGLPGTAPVGADYQITTGPLFWAPGTSNTLLVMVPVRGDLTYEGDETFLLTFNSPSKDLQTLLPVGTATIVDDDRSNTQHRGCVCHRAGLRCPRGESHGIAVEPAHHRRDIQVPHRQRVGPGRIVGMVTILNDDF
jgi:hypothetical protein